MPDTLEETYSQILIQTKEHRRDAIRILQFLMVSQQPLTVRELVDAIVVDPRSETPFNPDLRLENPEDVADICPSLVSVVTEPDRKIVQLAHLSVKEYLRSDAVPKQLQESFMETNALAVLTEVCLTYLSQIDATMLLNEIEARFPLARFAARNWMGFAKTVEHMQPIQEKILQLFHNPRRYKTWRKLFTPDQSWANGGNDEDNKVTAVGGATFALYDASVGGLWRTVGRLLTEGAYVDNHGGICDTPVQAASSRGHEPVVQTLIKWGANINPPDGGVYGCPLHAAVAEGHTEVVKLLVKEGADVRRQVKGYGSVLQLASATGHEELIEFLLKGRADDNDEGGRYGTALQAACLEGHVRVVELLLERGADVNRRGGIFPTTVERASRRGHRKIREPKVAEKISYSNTALQAACYRGNERIVQILLAHGADINALAGEYGAAMDAASSQGHYRIVVLLEGHASYHRPTSPPLTGPEYSVPKGAHYMRYPDNGPYGNVDVSYLPGPLPYSPWNSHMPDLQYDDTSESQEEFESDRLDGLRRRPWGRGTQRHFEHPPPSPVYRNQPAKPHSADGVTSPRIEVSSEFGPPNQYQNLAPPPSAIHPPPAYRDISDNTSSLSTAAGANPESATSLKSLSKPQASPTTTAKFSSPTERHTQKTDSPKTAACLPPRSSLVDLSASSPSLSRSKSVSPASLGSEPQPARSKPDESSKKFKATSTKSVTKRSNSKPESKQRVKGSGGSTSASKSTRTASTTRKRRAARSTSAQMSCCVVA
ncbi:ankyrin repeat-containing domain protein [Aspergillus multicolor]|uniref:ankyrin repeat-containing domain protein n=1 Tax=Aspergillus multicolor TaxID=41759 RepID=UPI003CCDCFFF